MNYEKDKKGLREIIEQEKGKNKPPINLFKVNDNLWVKTDEV
jgi:hypothetical protein